MEIGNPTKHGEKTAAMDARASWCIGKERFSLECRKTDSGDMRIVVNAYETSGVDQMRGLAESKLLRRVFQTLTGIKSYDPEDLPADSEMGFELDGKLASPIQIEQVSDPDAEEAEEAEEVAEEPPGGSEQLEEEESEFGGYRYNFPDAEKVLFFIDSCTDKISDCPSIDQAARMLKTCLEDMDAAGFSPNAIEFIKNQLNDRNASVFARYRGMFK
jgi:hypothetical protein